VGRHISVFRTFLEIDLPAVVASGTLSLPPVGRGRRRLRALRTVLDAFSQSGLPDRSAAAAFLEASVSLAPGLHLQEMCRIWLQWMETCGAAGADDASADQACDAIRNVNRALGRPPRVDLLERVFRPVRRLDRLLTDRWTEYLLFGVESRRAAVTEPVMLRCEAAWRRLRQQTAAKDELDRLWLRMRHRYAIRKGDNEDADRTARAWALLCRETQPLDAASLMLQNQQRLETLAAGAEDGDAESDEVLQLSQNYLEILPDDYDLCVARARALRRVGDFAACKELCTRAIGIRPNAYQAYSVRSNLHFLMEEYTNALRDAEQACRLAPDQPQGFIARGFVQLQMGGYEEALDDFDRALTLDPQRLDAMHGRGKCLSLLGEDREAMVCFNRLRRLMPEDPDIAYELADAMFAAGFLDDCLRVCGECLALDPTFTEAHVLLAVAETRRENDGLAFEHLERALAIEPDHPFALNEMGYLLHLQGRDGEAFDYIEQALDSFPDFTEALYNKATILYFQGLLDESYDLYEQILRTVPEHVSALIGKANVLSQMSELDEALIWYDEALKRFPRSAEACMGKSAVYRMMGLEEDGRKWQEKARMLEQENY
jgi:tetratricopeptide (TPR) repeat protein